MSEKEKKRLHGSFLSGPRENQTPAAPQQQIYNSSRDR